MSGQTKNNKPSKKHKFWLIVCITSVIFFLSAAACFGKFIITDIQADMLSQSLLDQHNGKTEDDESKPAILAIEPIHYTSPPKETPAETETVTTVTAIQSSEAEIETSVFAEEETIQQESVIQQTEPVLQNALSILPAMKALWKHNNDTAGWLKISNTKIDNIVVQTSNNDTYLHTSYEGKESQPGTLFIDYRCNLNDYEENQSSNIIIYGHNQVTGTMFGTLTNYKNNLQFYKDNPTIRLSSLYCDYTYKIVSVFVAATEEKNATDGKVFDYQNYIDLTDQTVFNEFVNQIKTRSQISIPVDIEYGDSFLTLSTCSYEVSNARFVVIARRVRNGEDISVDTSSAFLTNTVIY